MTQGEIRQHLAELRDLNAAEQVIRAHGRDPIWAIVLTAIDQWRGFITGALRLQDPELVASAIELGPLPADVSCQTYTSGLSIATPAAAPVAGRDETVH